MWWSKVLLHVPLLAPIVCAQINNGTVASGAPGPDVSGKYMAFAPGIRALFIPYDASISNLYINDSRGIERDIVMGIDNASYYSIDRQHLHLGGVPGRYANHIKNSSFVIDGVMYNVLPNENPTPANPQGVDTLHGGPEGWDWRDLLLSPTRTILSPFHLWTQMVWRAFSGSCKLRHLYVVQHDLGYQGGGISNNEEDPYYAELARR
jgi:hypothetical protein